MRPGKSFSFRGTDNFLSQAANPVALGKARARQMTLMESHHEECFIGDKVMCLQIHGDAAFTGQVIVSLHNLVGSCY